MSDLTVLLATFNGACVLPRTLEGYVNLAAGMQGWKLVIIDNASTDNSADIIDSFADRLPIQRVTAPEPGKNAALNKGLSAIEGEIIIITDDDAVPQPGFLDAWRAAFRDMPMFDVFGGSIEPLFDVAPPGWMLVRELKFEELYAQRKNLPSGAIEPHNIFGPNMAVRRKVFETGTVFNADIGPNNRDASYGMGSESEFCTRAYANGHAAGFAAGPKVQHIVRADQVTPAFWSARAYRLGRGVASRHWLSGEVSLRERPALVQAVLNAGRRAQRLGKSLARLHPLRVQRFKAAWEYNFFCGYQDEHKRRQAAARNAAD